MANSSMFLLIRIRECQTLLYRIHLSIFSRSRECLNSEFKYTLAVGEGDIGFWCGVTHPEFCWGVGIHHYHPLRFPNGAHGGRDGGFSAVIFAVSCSFQESSLQDPVQFSFRLALRARQCHARYISCTEPLNFPHPLFG